MPACAACNAPLVPAATGRPRRYCSPRCRKAASRARTAAWSAPPTPIEEEPAEAWLVGRESDPDAQVTAAVIEALLLAASLRRLSGTARKGLRHRCAGLADVIDEGLRRYFPV